MSNEARNAEIIRLRRAGMFPSDIAKEMGLSRNAVIGVCHRAGVVKFDQAASIKAHANPARGESSGRSKLSADQIARIRRLRSIMTLRELSERFGVSLTNIEAIVSRKTWKHVR